MDDRKEYIVADEWKIIEECFDPARVRSSESLFALGNGTLGGRARFEEGYSGPSSQGDYIGGLYYPDRTRVGWWKNGYPEYFARVPNSAFWPAVEVEIDGERLDLATVAAVGEFRRELDMRRGVLSRRMRVSLRNGVEVRFETVRFLPLGYPEAGVLRCAVTPLNRDAQVRFTPRIDADVCNGETNYGEKFWDHVATESDAVHMRVRRSGFEAAWAQCCRLEGASFEPRTVDGCVAATAAVRVPRGRTAVLDKYAGICSSLNHAPGELLREARDAARTACRVGFEGLLAGQEAAWAERWRICDVGIGGDTAAQQGIRFCIFMLLQTYAGGDDRLNIGPKGFTGDKYGGVTYWDTEAFCLPFYLATAEPGVARRLLLYRYRQLDRAIENAAKLGIGGGAALYPMVTANGEECHNEWEITFEEIHRNGAVAHAVSDYVRYTGDCGYLAEYGLEVLLSVARFWVRRVSWSEVRQRYVMLGVTGPNEYENNVDNNWYTSYVARWSLRYAAEAAEWVRDHRPDDFRRICAARRFDLETETARWRETADLLYLGEDRERGIFLQQDGYLDKEQRLASDLDPAERPLNRHWSWDRILRSCFIKQADVVQGLYFFPDDFDEETVRRNFLFYEARTVHESSLSPGVHAVVAARIGERAKAYELCLRAVRLDLDDYNGEVEEGCHVTSMAGSWLAVVGGFGGVRMHGDVLALAPVLPDAWHSLVFRLRYRGRVLSVRVTRREVEIGVEGDPVELELYGRRRTVAGQLRCMRPEER